jgi:methylmalonyl-CoA mutase C-terminal domain/subunit
MDDVLVFAGGIIPERDTEQLKEIGIAEIFPPGSSLQEIVDFVKKNIRDSKFEIRD